LHEGGEEAFYVTILRPLPHHRLVAYEVATELLASVVVAKIEDSRLRDQALRAAKSACLNIAEAAGRSGRADQARVFTIARAEACEAAAALEIAAIAGECTPAAAYDAHNLAHRLVRLLTGLIRPKRHAIPETPEPNPEPQPDAEALDAKLELDLQLEPEPEA
jgi:four helix bundle protein